MVEYAALVAIVVGALLAMHIYMQRGMSGRLRSASDSIGEQYAPKDTTSNMTLRMTGRTTTTSVLMLNQSIGNNMTADVMRTTATIDPANPETTSRTGNETVGPLGNNLWE